MNHSTPGLPVHHQLLGFTQRCPSSWWCHPAISSSVIPFSSCPQSLPASGSSPMSQLFAWGGQSTYSLFKKNFFYWNRVDLQCCVSFGYTAKWFSHVLVTQLCLTLCDSMDCSPPGSSVYGILQAEILEWVPIPFSMASSKPRDCTGVSCTAGRLFTVWAIREALFSYI